MNEQEKRPYYCEKCNRRHVKGKIFNEHREFRVECPECLARADAGKDSFEAFDACPTCKGGRERPYQQELDEFKENLARDAELEGYPDEKSQENIDSKEIQEDMKDKTKRVKEWLEEMGVNVDKAFTISYIPGDAADPEDIDLNELHPDASHVVTSAGTMEIVRLGDGMPIALFDPTDRTMRANLRLEQWEYYEPEPNNPDGRQLIEKPFTLCEKIKYGKEIAKAQGKKYTFFKKMADLRAWKKFCKEEKEHDESNGQSKSQ